MNPPKSAFYVVGHRNPDTDSLVSAHVLAWMYSQMGTPAQALRLGDPNPQSRWVFEQAGVELPMLREDCRPRVGEVCDPVRSVSPKDPLRKALRLIRESRVPMVPVLDDAGNVLGVIGEHSPRLNYLLHSNVEDMLGTLLPWEQVVEGLELQSVNKVAVEGEIRGLKFATGRERPSHFDVLISGTNPLDPGHLLSAEPAAIILVGPGECEALESQDKVPVFAYPGSVFAFCSSLCECFTCEAAMDTDYLSVGPEAVLSSTRAKLALSPQGLLVMDAEGKLEGLLSSQHLLEAEPPKIALVDHFERAQSVSGLDEAEIVAVVDHHRIGDIETLAPVDIDCRSWGSTASILFARCREAGLEVPASIAKLLLGALVSDTLLLRSPTTHARDRELAAELATLAGVDMEVYGVEVLRRNDRLLDAEAEEIVAADCKSFTHGKTRFMASQVETVDLDALSDTRALELERALAARASGTAFAALMITDVMRQVSRVSILSDNGDWAERFVAGGEQGAHVWLAEGFVSRKKQLIPYLLKKLPPTS